MSFRQKSMGDHLNHLLLSGSVRRSTGILTRIGKSLSSHVPRWQRACIDHRWSCGLGRAFRSSGMVFGRRGARTEWHREPKCQLYRCSICVWGPKVTSRVGCQRWIALTTYHLGSLIGQSLRSWLRIQLWLGRPSWETVSFGSLWVIQVMAYRGNGAECWLVSYLGAQYYDPGHLWYPILVIA